jgi:hypothetical protein
MIISTARWLAGNNVLDLERDHGLMITMQRTVFTPVLGAFTYKPAASGVHQGEKMRA